jgi:putative ABC transport system permease protein
MTVRDISAEGARVRSEWRTILAIGLRELRGGIKGFQVFIACLALGVMVIAAVGALADGLRAGFAKQGEIILGGDMAFSRMHIRATESERAIFQRYGTLSEVATMRTNARRLDGSDQALAELKAVDRKYPLAGAIGLESGGDFAAAVGDRGAVADGLLLERLQLKVGDSFRIGNAEIRIRGVLKSEPDGLAGRLTYGPRVFVSLATLEATGLVKPGTLIRWRYAIKTHAARAAVPETLKELRDEIARQMPESGFSSRDRFDPSPQVTRSLERLRQFLILIGLASLMIGGVGIANSVATFVDKRVKVIAILRSVGARGSQIFGVFLVQVLAMSAIGIAIGLVLGMLVPALIDYLFKDAFPIRADLAVSPSSLGIAALYGLLVSMIFALWPLGRTEGVRASTLFRDSVTEHKGWPRRAILIVLAALVAALIALALATSEPRSLVLYVTVGLTVTLVSFYFVGGLVSRFAHRAPKSSSPALALAIRNIGAPDGLTRSVVLSLGTGLSLLVAVSLANASLVDELQSRLPQDSPDYFLLDVPKSDLKALTEKITTLVPGAIVNAEPMLRGRIVSLKGTPAEELKPPPEAQWVLNGDRGLSYATDVPVGSRVVAGTWWDKGYAGPPLVSFDEELAHKLGLDIGDTVTVNVLGRNLSATIANLREIKWETIAINFVMVFSPNTLAAAPHNDLATIRLPPGTSRADEVALIRDLAMAFPAVSAIRVRDALQQFDAMFEKVMMAVQVAGSVTLLAGALVLAGALATAQRRRTLEAVILKTIGARRGQILAAHAAEYALLAGIAAVVAILLGTLVGAVAVTRVMDLVFIFSFKAIVLTLAVAAGLIAIFGSLGTLAVLRARPVPYLRSE